MKIELVAVPEEPGDENDILRRKIMRLEEENRAIKRYMRLIGCAIPPEFLRAQA